MSYMILMKNQNGAVMATDTRLLAINYRSTRQTNRGKKLVFSAPLKFALSILGDESYSFGLNDKRFFHYYLERFINQVVNNNIATYINRTLPQIIAAFLIGCDQNNVFPIAVLQQCHTIFTGIHFKNGQFETVDFDMHDILDIVFNPAGIDQAALHATCSYQQLMLTQSEIITGGDHILAWAINAPPHLTIADVILQYKQWINVQSLDFIEERTQEIMQSTINHLNDRSIGGFTDYVKFDNNGNIIANNINNPNPLTHQSICADYKLTVTQGKKVFKTLHKNKPLDIEKKIQTYIDNGHIDKALMLYRDWGEMRTFFPAKRKLRNFLIN